MATLVTLEQIKAWLGIDPSDTSQDALLTQLNESVTASIERYCERIFGKATYDETHFRPVDPYELMLKQFPVTTLTSITADDEVLDVAEYYVDPETGIVYGLYEDYNPANFQGYTKVVVNYEAGFDPIPPDLQTIALQLVAMLYNMQGEDPTLGPIKFERVDGGASVSYSTKAKEALLDGTFGDPLLQEYAASLDPFRSDRAILW